MPSPTHFRGILFQTAPVIFNNIDQARRVALIDSIITASKAGDAVSIATALANLNAFDAEFTVASPGQVATKQRVTDWLAGVQEALTKFISEPQPVSASDTVFIASIPEFGLNAFTLPRMKEGIDQTVGSFASAANVIPATLEAYIVQALRTLLTTHFNTRRVLFVISCCTYGVVDNMVHRVTLHRDGPLNNPGHEKIGGLSQITVIPSQLGLAIKNIPKERRVQVDQWDLDKFANLFNVNYAADNRQARLRFDMAFPGDPLPAATLGFSTCADGQHEDHPNVNLCMYLGDSFPLQQIRDTTHSFLLNDTRGWIRDSQRDTLFRTGFYLMHDNANPPSPADVNQLNNILKIAYTKWEETSVSRNWFFGLVKGAKKIVVTPRLMASYPSEDHFKNASWSNCEYDPSVLSSKHFFPSVDHSAHVPGRDPTLTLDDLGPVICRATIPIPIPARA
ncbi:hypothetical protein MIND_00795400 [Mycena indigotica]|uniref:Uncharacterized protein n=1 Tax=Mycena indigotica TaxID=2126181 RepID=A0A8H6W482_9AGAR|nr:uncharacterized protein MIND_00795400 [Mycena indigotica]KAF7302281.1 hypothetical protein MIND_00795400 [Mycena indigotica]